MSNHSQPVTLEASARKRNDPDAATSCMANGSSHFASATPEYVHRLIERQAIRNPEALAASSRIGTLSYAELNARADDLAQQLRALGAGPEMVVGIYSRRSAAMLVGALGILKSGAAYLPIDPADPAARSELMLDDADVSIVIIESSTDAKRYERRRTVALDYLQKTTGAAGEIHFASDGEDAVSKNLAYVIYTSGSTGTPKGVEITHRNLSNLVSWHQSAFAVTAQDRASHIAKVGFDAGIWEVWPYLACGASLHLPPEEILNDPEAFQTWLIEQRITISFVPTSLAERLIALDWSRSSALRIMLTGGDALHHYPRTGLPFLLVNNYGPTECTVVATSGIVPAGSQSSEAPPIGRPISNTGIYILDESLNRLPVGAVGEIHIGGAGIGRGYRNQPALTAERFIQNPFRAGERLFRTGDLGRFLPDGQIAFLGRADDQIKIRGFRMEPNEIISALNAHPAIAQSVVVARDLTPGDRQLVAYVVPRAASCPSPTDLRNFLSARLPSYMVPAILVKLESLPLTPNGKVDRDALPHPNDNNTIGNECFRSPQTEVETIVAGVLAPLLGVEHVDVDANFFSLGGHSLLGTQLISRLRERLGIDVPLRTVFEAPSVTDLSTEIEKLLLEKVEAMSTEEVQRALNSHEALNPDNIPA